jgi:uncharacterized protein (DUF2252 family)
MTRQQSIADGKAARARAPRESQRDFDPPASRDPVGLLLEQAKSRIPELAPVRNGRMLLSPFTFYRGAALPMAADLATTPDSGLRVQLCGDAHLSNFGVFGSPERRLVFDVNDFDETLPGPFEWDVKRLVASLIVAGRENGFGARDTRRVAVTAVATYRRAMREFAASSAMDVWYARLDVEEAIARFRSQLKKGVVKQSELAVAKARTRDSTQAVARLTTVTGGQRRIISDPPLIVPVEQLAAELDVDTIYKTLRSLLSDYARTLPADRQYLLGRFELTRMARKVVGVGSVGTEAWIVLMDASDGTGPLLLQAKQAQRSVLAAYAGESQYDNQGERVVTGQRLMQAASDIFLGWQRATVPDGAQADYYVRQLQDWKYSAPVEQMNPSVLAGYGGLCGWTLARAHARSGDRIAIAAYLGNSDRFDEAIADFGATYADQTTRDHAAFAEAVDSGRVQAQVGVLLYGRRQRAAPRCWGGRLIRAANRSRRLTTPHTVRPSMMGRCRKPFSSIICAASSTVVSGSADWGSLVIHAETWTMVRSVPDAAARRTSRSVRMPARKLPCMTRAEPTLSRTISAAASDMGLSGVVSTTRVCIISPTVRARRPSSATFAHLEQLGVVRGGRPGELLGEQSPERPGPGRQLRPPHPEQLQRRLVELGMRLVRADRVGEVLELVDQVEEPVGAIIHSHHLRRGRAASAAETGAERIK